MKKSIFIVVAFSLCGCIPLYNNYKDFEWCNMGVQKRNKISVSFVGSAFSERQMSVNSNYTATYAKERWWVKYVRDYVERSGFNVLASNSDYIIHIDNPCYCDDGFCCRAAITCCTLGIICVCAEHYICRVRVNDRDGELIYDNANKYSGMDVGLSYPIIPLYMAFRWKLLNLDATVLSWQMKEVEKAVRFIQSYDDSKK